MEADAGVGLSPPDSDRCEDYPRRVEVLSLRNALDTTKRTSGRTSRCKVKSERTSGSRREVEAWWSARDVRMSRRCVWEPRKRSVSVVVGSLHKIYSCLFYRRVYEWHHPPRCI